MSISSTSTKPPWRATCATTCPPAAVAGLPYPRPGGHRPAHRPFDQRRGRAPAVHGARDQWHRHLAGHLCGRRGDGLASLLAVDAPLDAHHSRPSLDCRELRARGPASVRGRAASLRPSNGNAGGVLERRAGGESVRARAGGTAPVQQHCGSAARPAEPARAVSRQYACR